MGDQAQAICDRSNLFAIGWLWIRPDKSIAMAVPQSKKPADSLAALPSAKELLEQMALREAEKTSAAMRELSAADAEKRH